MESRKHIIYQVFTRLFGNKNRDWVPWAGKEMNGVGKFSDFDKKALKAIKELGTSHIWFTGVLQHALIGDYTSLGISKDHPDVVKGRAGSPYAVKDYFDVDPDLADDPQNRMEEFEALIKRTHEQGMKVIIDIVPNHVARSYQTIQPPEGFRSFGIDDNKELEYHRNNDFYYVPGQAFQVPDWKNDYLPLNGEDHYFSEKMYNEFPAKWTGNGARTAKPDQFDWYETIKINYGIKPDGSHDFPELPQEMLSKSNEEIYSFWKEKDLPASWYKWKMIVDFWLKKGVDGFRYDMAEMLPLAFWSFLNSYIKKINSNCTLIAEVYNPELYRPFIQIAKMDLLYDKVDLYDKLKEIIQEKASCNEIFPLTEKNHDVSAKFLHFLENHDEQRIASSEFADDPFKALPAMVLSACIDQGDVMIYFGQEVGEKASDDPGFGSPTRTSIFDYVGVPAHQRWMNEGLFDGAKLSNEEKQLRQYYSKLLNFVVQSKALKGTFYDLHRHNATWNSSYPSNKIYAFARYCEEDKLIVINNFDQYQSHQFTFDIYYGLIKNWNLSPGNYSLNNLFDSKEFNLIVKEESASIEISLTPLESLVLKLN